MSSLNRMVVAGLAVVIAVLIVLEGLVWNAAERSSQMFFRVMHTHSMINSLTALLSDLDIIEIEQRDYLITGSKDCLSRFRKAIASLDSDMAVVVANDSRQKQDIRRILEEIGAYKSVLESTVTPYPIPDFDAIRKILSRNHGVYGTIRNKVNAMVGNEIDVLNQRNRLETASIRQEHVSIAILSIFVAATLFVLFRRLYLDISRRIAFEAKLKHQASHDVLTGLANRSLFFDRIAQAIIHAGRVDRVVMVMLIDLDRFKLINDSLGHGVGDELLKVISRRLSENTRPGDTVARLGGDEFALMMSDMADEADAAFVAENILGVLAEPMTVGGHDLVVRASIGISVFPRDGSEVSALLKNADSAMYQVKESGRNSFRFYTPEMNDRMIERLDMEAGLRNALKRGELRLYYQPKVELESGRVVGAEALMRWIHPVLGVVPPSEFIPVAEDTGMILSIGEWAIEEACRQISAWRNEGCAVISLSINLSAGQLRQEHLSDMVESALAKNGVSPEHLELEVTESAVMQNPEAAIAIMNKLKRIGIGISLDDFGTGYSSLNYLKRFPVDTLKIDQSFIREIASDPNDAAIVHSVITLAHSLNRKTVAEGVETQAQLEFLSRNRCDQIQGFLFSPPLPAEEFIALLREDRRLRLAEIDVKDD